MMKLVAFSLVLTLAIASVSNAQAPAPSPKSANGVVVPSTSKPVESTDSTVIHVINELKDAKKAMRVHCKSKLEDLGTHEVPVGSELQWRIKNTADVTVHPFSCIVSGNDKDAVFKAYYEDAELLRRVNENNSYWVAKDDGIYLRQVAKNTDVLVQPWN
ncbi:S-protein homolog 74 [Linum grandiflorum]